MLDQPCQIVNVLVIELVTNDNVATDKRPCATITERRVIENTVYTTLYRDGKRKKSRRTPLAKVDRNLQNSNNFVDACELESELLYAISFWNAITL